MGTDMEPPRDAEHKDECWHWSPGRGWYWVFDRRHHHHDHHHLKPRTMTLKFTPEHHHHH